MEETVRKVGRQMLIVLMVELLAVSVLIFARVVLYPHDKGIVSDYVALMCAAVSFIFSTTVLIYKFFGRKVKKIWLMLDCRYPLHEGAPSRGGTIISGLATIVVSAAFLVFAFFDKNRGICGYITSAVAVSAIALVATVFLKLEKN